MIDHVTRLAAAAFVASICVAATAGPAAADNPTVLGVSRSWGAYTQGTGRDKVCYALSQPKSSLPRKAKRDPIFFLINDWPGRNARAEPEVVPGYKVKEGSMVTAEVGAEKFTFFTQNNGDDGQAWIKETTDEQRLVNAMQNNSQMIVTGVSARGTTTRDTYSLDGLADALTKIHSACGM